MRSFRLRSQHPWECQQLRLRQPFIRPQPDTDKVYSILEPRNESWTSCTKILRQPPRVLTTLHVDEHRELSTVNYCRFHMSQEQSGSISGNPAYCNTYTRSFAEWADVSIEAGHDRGQVSDLWATEMRRIGRRNEGACSCPFGCQFDRR